MDSKNLLTSQNFDFIAFTLALYVLNGKELDIGNVTSLLSDENRRWFVMRFNHFLEQLNISGDSGSFPGNDKIFSIIKAPEWTDPTPVDKFCPHDEACSKASGLTPPR